MTAAVTIDPPNVALFARMAAEWWNPHGPNRLLHALNPARLAFIRRVALAHFDRDPKARRPLQGLVAVDVGCGGGLVSEPLARMGAAVTGLDAAPESIAIARRHAEAQGLAIAYETGEVGPFAEAQAGRFDLATALEVVEHVADVGAFLRALRTLLRPGGLLLFSTPNRTLASLAIVKVGAEYVARALPRGAHDWRKFLTPEELARRLAGAGFAVKAIEGIGWTPTQGFRVGGSRQIGYIGAATAV